jgi:hypothetical protein
LPPSRDLDRFFPKLNRKKNEKDCIRRFEAVILGHSEQNQSEVEETVPGQMSFRRTFFFLNKVAESSVEACSLAESFGITMHNDTPSYFLNIDRATPFWFCQLSHFFPVI